MKKYKHFDEEMQWNNFLQTCNITFFLFRPQQELKNPEKYSC